MIKFVHLVHSLSLENGGVAEAVKRLNDESNNIGVHYNNFNTQNDFMNMENSKEYETVRNKYFTPELKRIRLLVDSKNVDHTLMW